MPNSANSSRLCGALLGVRLKVMVLLLLVALAAGLVADWIRDDRVFFARPLPKFITVPAGK
jgi:hypothetical protein